MPVIKDMVHATWARWDTCVHPIPQIATQVLLKGDHLFPPLLPQPGTWLDPFLVGNLPELCPIFPGLSDVI